MTKVVVLTATLLVGAAVASGEEPRIEKTLSIPGQGSLRMSVPPSWQMKSRPAPANASSAEFTPPAGDDFDVLITVIAPQPGGKDSLDPAALRKTLERYGKEPLAQAVELALDIKELKGPDVQGFYFSLTDKDPGDSYKYLTQGQFRVGSVLAAVTILQRTDSAAVRNAALDLIRTATLAK